MSELQDFVNNGFQIPVYDEIVCHPDDYDIVPEIIRSLWLLNGVSMVRYRFMPRGFLVGTGRGAQIIANLKFHQDVQKAMEENEKFLALMRSSGLA